MAPETRRAVAFVRVLRSAGLDVPLGSTLVYVNALAELDVTSRSQVYWAGRATLVRRPEDVAVYDRVFARFWQGVTPASSGAGRTLRSTLVDRGPVDDAADRNGERDDEDDRAPADPRRAGQPGGGVAAQGLRAVLRRPSSTRPAG